MIHVQQPKDTRARANVQCFAVVTNARVDMPVDAFSGIASGLVSKKHLYVCTASMPSKRQYMKVTLTLFFSIDALYYGNAKRRATLDPCTYY